MSLPITSLFAAVFGLLMLLLWMNVTKTRAARNISIGHADDADLHERMRKHGNFMEWVPMTLILMALLEGQLAAQGGGALWLYTAGGFALLGRIIHPFGLRASNASHPLRIVGNMGNMIAFLILIAGLFKTTLLN